MQNMITSISETVQFIQSKIRFKPYVGIVLGTGLDTLTHIVNVYCSIPYREIPNFPLSTVEFHKGNLLFGEIGGKQVVIMQGRFHYYEGYSMHQITYPIRVMQALGVAYLLLSNAAGGINLQFKKGNLVLINDHINNLPENPLRGLNDPSFGNRFVDMSQPYSKMLNNLIQQTALKLNFFLQEGVYVSVQGPNLETRAEYRYLRYLGADMVGMSTVPEVIVANHIGLPCSAISVITDECNPDNLQPVNIAEIIEVAAQADKKLSQLFAAVIQLL